ncbi:MAG: SDR family oxidoreductase [Gemmatimonadetes bacterium]|nr:SDR family oxidoreductase [Gemmatimonadota bacterium]
MSDKLRGKVAIVTGASSGIGEAAARALAAEGAHVVVAARRAERLAALVSDIEESGGIALAVPTDVTKRESVEALVRQTLDAFGRLDILVNNAGIMPLSLIRKLHVEEWDRMIDVNIKGVLYCIAACLPSMLDQGGGGGGGHIVNVSSVAGRRPFPGGTIYSATKFAVRAISQGIHLELSAKDRIRVVDIEPGVVGTELTDHITDEDIATRFETTWADKTRLRASDVSEAILFAVTQPDRVNVNEILVRPTDQET